MDTIESAKEVSDDVTREALIALSYTTPEKELPSENSTGKARAENGVEAVKGDGDDKYRSKLISISYSQSPDTKPLPVLPGDCKG